MLSVERKYKIAEVVGKNGGVKTSDLSNMFSVSEMTILRDLEILEQQGILKRVYGGAVNLKSPIKELSVILRKQINAKEKNIIAEKAAKLITNGESIFLDSSTTAFALSKKLGHKTGLTVITNGLELINELKNNSNINLFCPGGELQLSTMSFIGTSAEDYLKEHYVDKAFVSASGISLQSGITVENAVQAVIKKIMFKNALSRVILVDSSKFDVVRLSKVCTLEDINTIVTDRKPDAKFLEVFEKNNIEVVY
jgi:DeoR family transcriptional regulator, fructose operon transcriptional repressor